MAATQVLAPTSWPIEHWKDPWAELPEVQSALHLSLLFIFAGQLCPSIKLASPEGDAVVPSQPGSLIHGFGFDTPTVEHAAKELAEVGSGE